MIGVFKKNDNNFPAKVTSLSVLFEQIQKSNPLIVTDCKTEDTTQPDKQSVTTTVVDPLIP